MKCLSTEFSKKSQLAMPILTRKRDVHYVIYSISENIQVLWRYIIYDTTQGLQLQTPNNMHI